MLESPLEDAAPLLGEQIELRGWALGTTPVDRVSARCGALVEQTLGIGIGRADVAGAFADWPGAGLCGFSGWLDIAALPRETPQWLTVTVSAGGRDVHVWRRQLAFGDIDIAYTQWRQRLDAALEPAPPAAPGEPLATWLVCGSDAAAAAERLRACGHGCWDTRAVAAQDNWAQLLGSIATPYVGLVHAGDVPAPGAAAALRGELERGAADIVYGDHDHGSGGGLLHDPVLKPGWSPLLGRHPDVADRGWLVRRDLLAADPGWPGAGLPAAAAARCRQAWQWQRSLFTRGEHQAPAPSPREAAVEAAARVSVIVPTRLARADLLARCLDGVRGDRIGRDAEIVVALNNLGAAGPDAARDAVARWSTKTIHLDGSFNWSRISNAGARATSGDWLLFLNDDVEPLRRDWIAAMLALARSDAAIGAVGAVLRYPDGRVQHAGIYVHGGDRPECRHSFRHCSGDEARVRRWLCHDRAQTAVTGACLLTPRHAFEQLGGFDETLPVVFNDVDYCLRLRDSGFACAVAAGAELRHHEGASRGGIAEEADRERFSARWAASLPLCDPYSHPALTRDRDDWMFDPRRSPASCGPTAP